MVSLIHNGSEITTWMVYNFKTESKSNIFKSQATFLRKTSFLNFVRLAQRQLELHANSQNQLFLSLHI